MANAKFCLTLTLEGASPSLLIWVNIQRRSSLGLQAVEFDRWKE